MFSQSYKIRIMYQIIELGLKGSLNVLIIKQVNIDVILIVIEKPGVILTIHISYSIS